MKKTILIIILFALCVSISSAGVTDKLRAVVAAKNAGVADVTAPTWSSTTVATDGDAVTVVFSENLNDTALGGGEFDLDCDGVSGADNVLVYSSGDGTNTWVFTATSTVQSGESCTTGFDGAANEAEDDAGNDLADYGPEAVTNNSTQSASCALGDEDFEAYNDGDDVGMQAGWSETAEAGDNFDVDTGIAGADSSAKSMYVTVTSSGSVRVEYDAMVDQSSGSFNVSFYLRVDDESSAQEVYPFDIRDAAGKAAVSLRLTGNGDSTLDVDYGTGSSYANSGVDIDIDTWYKIDIEIDMEGTPNQSIAISGSQIANEVAFYEALSGALTKLSFSNYSGNAVQDYWIDEICIESGDYAY